MKKLTKNYSKALELVEKGKAYTVAEAVELLKKIKFAKFNETVTVTFNLGVDPKQADQQIRGAIVLPNGTGKTVRVLAITRNEEVAKKAGADFVGGTEIIDKIRTQNWFDYDVIVATPDMMGELGKIGKVLGPKGLMPNPKTGTVTPDIAKAITEQKAGKVNYRVDKDGNVAVTCGLIDFDSAKLVENINAVISTIIKVKPATVKGTYMKSCFLTATMTPSVKLTVESK